MLLGILAFGAATFAVSAAISFVCNDLSEEEQRRQDSMLDEYERYKRRRAEEYKSTCRYYENRRHGLEEEYTEAIWQYEKELTQRKKRENQKTLDKMLQKFEEQYSEKNKLLQDCRDILDTCEKSIDKQQNTYMRFKSIKSTLISLQEAVYKLEAYIQYMEQYKRELLKLFERTWEITEPFSMILPEDYPYEGKLIFLEKSLFRGYGYAFKHGGVCKP